MCGHHPLGKVSGGGLCLSCNGSGAVSLELAEKLISDYNLDCEPELAAERGRE